MAVVNGHAHVYTPVETRRWEAQLADLARTHLPRTILEEPLLVDVCAVMPRPKSMLQRYAKPRPDGHGEDARWKYPAGWIVCVAKPDIDNVEKAVWDALKPFWRDDAQIVAGRFLKVYAEATGQPRVIVRIQRLYTVTPEWLFQGWGGL